MFEILKNIFGKKDNSELIEAINNGAVLIDVRTQGEFEGGHVKGSINIPLNTLSNKLGKLKKDKTIVVFCASGMRSSQAKGILTKNGFSAINGGGWRNVNTIIDKK